MYKFSVSGRSWSWKTINDQSGEANGTGCFPASKSSGLTEDLLVLCSIGHVQRPGLTMFHGVRRSRSFSLSWMKFSFMLR